MNRLEEILGAKRQEIERLRPQRIEIDQHARARTNFRSFHAALQRPDNQTAVIADRKSVV